MARERVCCGFAYQHIRCLLVSTLHLRNGVGVRRVPPPAFISHPAGQVPRLSGKLTRPRARSCTRLAVMALASLRVPPPPLISHPAGHVPRVLGKMIWPCACPRLRLDVMALASSRVPPLPFISHPTGQVPRVLGKMTWLRACSGSRLAVTRRRHHSCAATPIRIPSCWPCACVLGVLMLSRACSCSRLAVMAAESLPCCRPRSYPNARVLMLMRVGSGCSILRMPLPLLVSHRAGQMPCVLGGSMWPRACLGSRLAVMAAASLVCRRQHSCSIPLALCFACWTC